MFVVRGKVGVVESVSGVFKKLSPSALPRERKLQKCAKLSICKFRSVKVKVKVTPTTDHEGPEGE